MKKVMMSLLLACAAAPALAGGEDKALDDHWSITLAGKSDFEVSVAIVQESPDAIADESASDEVHPVLDFRCPARGDGTVTLQIDWRRFISSFNTEVGFRVDGGKATWIKMGVDSSNKITLGKAADTTKLINTIAGGKTLNVEVAPYSEPSVFVNFDVSTLPAALEKLRDACQ